MYHDVAPAGGGEAARTRAPRRAGARRCGALRALPPLLAGVVLTLTAGIVVAAGPPDGLGHTHGNPLGPPPSAVHAHTDGHGHDRDADGTTVSAPAVHGAADQAPRALGLLRADLDEITAEVLAAADSDLMPPRNRHHAGASPGNSQAPSPSSSSTSTSPATSVTTPFTGGAAARNPVTRSAPGQGSSGHFGVAVPSLPGVTLIPPASLPSPATFLPAAPARGALPMFVIAGAVALLAGVVGLRILRRPG